MIASGFLLTSLVALAFCKPATRNLKLHEALEGPPAGYSLTGSADPNQTLKLRLSVTQSNIPELERKLYDVSTPSSHNYGKHLSKSEVQQLVAPAQDSVDAVNDWLKENGITAMPTSATGDAFSFEVPVSKANELFGADFSVFKHDDTGVEAVRTLSYSIPAELQGHLDFVHPTVTFPDPVGRLPFFRTPDQTTPSVQNSNNPPVPYACLSRITPACLQAIYNIPVTPATQLSNHLAVAGFIRQYANQDDLQTFLHDYRPDISVNTTFILRTLDGGSNPQNASQAGAEANLDTQYTVGVATGVPTEFISVGGKYIGSWLDLADLLLSQDHPPSVLTTSYSFNEPGLSPKVAQNLCNKYAQLGARGVSLLFSSGDGGVSGAQRKNCTTFIPTFPSTCPFITSVGASQGFPETAAALSAGGFSNVFGTPDYQSSAVRRYVAALGGANQGLYNVSGRAYPDVAAQGIRYRAVIAGREHLLDGTSASTPVFASIVALLNDRLVAKGKAPLGFLNPLLYSDAGQAALNDVVDGSNPGCGTSGFLARQGWDPVTGLGTPDFTKLARAVGV
ncbi:hypothetical protein GSI_04691 [Ganoderma sinense ZZ0214-1]|uniref:tripeptidyl-peptidase II n=1 Tax=Ganoderma sinense ZZ0214-1 TaxID=1077348 RepID=A0A2G8SHL8_9APHY|nr:hypothetical protein GSI_04691 [Ganoderma sinense ZZ0214-1]